jgi:hypothetical protein
MLIPNPVFFHPEPWITNLEWEKINELYSFFVAMNVSKIIQLPENIGWIRDPGSEKTYPGSSVKGY